LPGQNVESLRLSGEEIFAIGDTPGQLKAMLDNKFADGKVVTVFAESDLGKTTEFSATVRIDTPQEILYYQNGGILQYVLRQLAAKT
jgi:aconitate hydratase